MTRLMLRCLLMVALAGCGRTVSNLSDAPSPSDLPGFARPYEQVFNAAVDAATGLKWSIQMAQKDAGIITATPPIRLMTGGQRVNIRVVRGTGSDSLVHVGLSQLNTSDQRSFYERLTALLK